MTAGDSRAVQPSQHLAIQIAKNAAGPDLLILGDREARDAAGAAPLGQELAVRVEDFDPLVVAIGDVDTALRIDDEVVREAELAGTLAALAPLRQKLAVARVLHDA